MEQNTQEFENITYEDFQKLLKSAKQDTEDHYNLIDICFEELGLMEYKVLAKNYLLDEAEKGNSVAQELLGECYHYGIYQDLEQAEKWYTKAAAHGNAIAMLRMGFIYRFEKRIESREIAQQSQNYIDAAIWFKRAANAGQPNGCFWLGFCYNYGEGVKQDYNEAVKWYTKAIEKNNVNAMYHMAECYRNGWGVPIDKKKAEDLHKTALAREDEMESSFRSYYYDQDGGICYKINESETYSYDGFGVSSWEIATLTKAEQGDAGAQYEIGEWYNNEFNNAKMSEENAAKWYRKAAEQGHLMAISKLGDCYYYGKGVKQDYKEAIKWYFVAVKKEEVSFEIASRLSNCYRLGNGVDKDLVKAEEWKKEAEILNERDFERFKDFVGCKDLEEWNDFLDLFGLGQLR